MKQAIIRKTLTGEWTSFTFPERGKKFYVKNFSAAPVYVSFAENDHESSSFKILAKMGEEVCMSYENRPYPYAMFFTLWVKGEGEVEVQSEDIVVPDDFVGE